MSDNFQIEDVEMNEKIKTRMPVGRKILIIVLSVILFFSVCYGFFAFSRIPFIEKWRTIYIETAMSTKTHQWLAEWFLPQSMIDEVLLQKQEALDKQAELISEWNDEEEEEDIIEEATNNEQEEFYKTYWELDSISFKSYLDLHPDILMYGYENIIIEDLEGNLGLKTSVGDPVIVVNVPENIIVISVSGSSYQGKLAICKNPKKVCLAKSKSLGSFGQEVGSFAADNDAIITMNASMFSDKNGHGSGGVVKGSLIIDGVEYGKSRGADWKFLGFKYDDRMYISNVANEKKEEYRWAIEVFPALIVNGEMCVDGTFGMGIHPRSSIAQTRTGDVLLMVIDGRQVGWSLGCTVSDCAKHLTDYGAYQAINVDGGSSSVMFYKGEQITKSSSATGRGRYIPDAIFVKKTENM